MNEQIIQIADRVLRKHPDISDKLYTANVWFEMSNTRYDFHKFLYQYIDGAMPSEKDLIEYRRSVLKKD